MSGDQHGEHKSGLAASVIALLTREASRVPLRALSIGMRAWEQGRPVRELALRRGNEALQIVAHTPLGRFLPKPVHDDDADAEGQRIAAEARQASAVAAARATARSAPPKPPPPATPPPNVTVPKAEKDLPLPDFDNISIGSLRARLRNLALEDLETLLAWEQEHANRVQVVTLLSNRIHKVSAAGSASS